MFIHSRSLPVRYRCLASDIRWQQKSYFTGTETSLKRKLQKTYLLLSTALLHVRCKEKGPFLPLFFSTMSVSFFWERIECFLPQNSKSTIKMLTTLWPLHFWWRIYLLKMINDQWSMITWWSINVIWKQLAYSDFLLLAVFLYSWPFPLSSKEAHVSLFSEV